MAKSETETVEFAGMIRRIVRAYARRVAAADDVDLADMLAIRRQLDEAIQAAVDGLRAQGHSWAYVAAGAGITRQAAQQRWGRESH